MITDDLTSPYLQKLQPYSVQIVDYKQVVSVSFLEIVNANISKFCIAHHLGDRKLLFIRCFERFFLLENYMRQANASNVLFLELDVMIYSDPTVFLPFFKEKEMTLSFVTPQGYCSGYCYIQNISFLSELNAYFAKFIQEMQGVSNDRISEMEALTRWIQVPTNKDRIFFLPCLWKDTHHTSDAWINIDVCNQVLFDGAGIAINVDGPDECHYQEWLRKGKVWWGTEIQYNKYPYEWREVNGFRSLYLTSPEGKAYPVHCLHVHNKKLTRFLSKPLDDTLSGSFPSGDQFLFLADCVLRTKTRPEYYPVVGWSQATLRYFEDIVGPWDNPALLFCTTEDLPHFRKLLDHITNRFVLLTHNSDVNITEEYSWLSSHPLLSHWFTQNLCAQLPKTSFLPIGIANPTWSHGNVEMISYARQLAIEKSHFVYANFRTSTNPGKREPCKQVIEQCGIPFFPIVDPFENLKRLAASRFTICPEGNGIDTHRFWEALFMKTIPIVLRSPFTESLKAEGYPCVLLDSWSEINPEKLSYTPEVFTPELEAKLHVSYFKNLIEKEVAIAKKNARWALTFVANEVYFQRAIETISEARTKGNWRDAIVLFVPQELASQPRVEEITRYFQVTLNILPSRDLSPILSKWNSGISSTSPETTVSDFTYAKARPFIYMKFYMFSTLLRTYDFIFYLDAGCKIQGDLNRFKNVCTDTSCLYAHSDAYPRYEWKLRGQFLLEDLPEDERDLFEMRYSLDTDYFQSTLMIFHTKIIQDTTVEELFALAEASPISRRMDQGIFNLYFLCQKALWKQIPLRDSVGFLYDYHSRPGQAPDDYCVLKFR